jgi:hypothetical protein
MVGVEPPPENCGAWLIIRQNETQGGLLDINVSLEGYAVLTRLLTVFDDGDKLTQTADNRVRFDDNVDFRKLPNIRRGF